MTQQTTLAQAISCSGIGLHRGTQVHMRLLPAKENAGIVFRRTDVDRKVSVVPARYDLVCDTRLGTTLKNSHGTTISTIEHLMAALWGMGIDNALIELDGPEVPIMDGSSAPFVSLLEQAGTKRLDASRKVLRVLREVEVLDGDSVARVSPYEGPDYACSLDVVIEFSHQAISRQAGRYDFGHQSFAGLLDNARTFGFAHEVEAMRAHGLALGGSLDNAVVVGEHGVLNEGGLRSGDEFVRHKALDCLGDLFLAGYRIEGAFHFIRPGHGINNKLLHALFADASAWRLVSSTRANAPVDAAQAMLAGL